MPLKTVIFRCLNFALGTLLETFGKHSSAVIYNRVETVAFLIIAICTTIMFEVLSNFRSPTSQHVTVLQYLQAAAVSDPYFHTTMLCGILSLLYLIKLTRIPVYGVIIVYTFLVKFVELIPPLIDLVDFLFIYQHTMILLHNEQKQSGSMHLIFPPVPLVLSLLFAFARVILAVRFIRQKTIDEPNSKTTVMIYDVILLFLVTTLGYSPRYPLCIIRKILLTLLVLNLNNFFQDIDFWLAVTNKGVEAVRNSTLEKINKIFHVVVGCIYEVQWPKHQNARWILVIRLIICYSVVCILYYHSLDLPNVEDLHVQITVRSIFYLLLQPDFLIPCTSLLLLGLLGWDTFQYSRELDQYGVVWFCTGLDYLPNWESDKKSGGTAHLRSPLPERRTIETLNTNYSRTLNPVTCRSPPTELVTTTKQMPSFSVESSITDVLDDQSNPSASSQPDTMNANPDTMNANPDEESQSVRIDNGRPGIANKIVEDVILQFYDNEHNVIIRSVSEGPSKLTTGDVDEAKDGSRFELQPNDVVIMQLGNTGVGKSSICQALTDNLNFRIGTENGTTLVPRAGVIPDHNCAGLRIVLIDVPGLNQAVVGENRRLFVQHPGVSDKKKLELEDIEELILKLAKLMMVCLIVVDQQILEGFKDVYDKVLTLLAKGVRDSDPDKYQNTSDDDLRKKVKSRIIIVRNKCDTIYDHKNPDEMIETEADNIKQVLELTDEPICFIAAGAYSAKKGQGNFSEAAVHRLNTEKFLKMIDELKKTINEKIDKHAGALIEQLDAKNARNKILEKASELGADRIQQRHRVGHVVITVFANVPNGVRCAWYRLTGKDWQIGCGFASSLEKKVPLHEHPLSIFLGRNERSCYVCQICTSSTDKGEFTQVWWYCKHAECKDQTGKWYVVHEECAEIYETTCDKNLAEN